jgi:serine/threonine-protein kinase
VLNGRDDPPTAEFRGAGFAPGSTFGSFRIERRIGKGGMAAVYQAQEGLPLERIVALKVLPPEFLHDDSFAKRFVNEARIIASLEHTGIVPIYASGIEDGIPWISMRLLTGGTLGELLERGPLSVDRTVSVLADVAGALDYAHARGVVHRDIKPSNTLLDGAGRAYVADFGLARLIEPIEHWTRSGTVIGTPQYMAPEQGMTGTLDERCDTYSLGVVAYEMLTGAPPFTGDSPIAVMMQHANSPVPAALRQRCPGSTCLAVEKALAKDPDDRWGSSAAFVHALSSGVAVHRPRRGSTIAATAAGFAIVLATAGALWWTRPDVGQGGTGDKEQARDSREEIPPKDEPTGPTDPFSPVGGNKTKEQTDKPQPPKSPPADTASTAGGERETKSDVAGTGTDAPVEQLVTNVPPPAQPEPGQKAAVIEEPPKAVPTPSPRVEIVPPALAKSETVSYPSILRLAASKGAAPRQAAVVLRGTVGEDGRVIDLGVEDVTPRMTDAARKVFVEEAMKAFQRFRYTPAQQNGVPVRHPITQTIKFDYTSVN